MPKVLALLFVALVAQQGAAPSTPGKFVDGAELKAALEKSIVERANGMGAANVVTGDHYGINLVKRTRPAGAIAHAAGTEVHYITEGGGMAVPAGQDIRLVLESRDVIHAFYVPQFLFKRDANPGRVTEFEFRVKPEDAGKTFSGQCAELCGSGHRLMTFEVKALTQADFDAWLQEHIDQANATPPPPASGEPPAPGESGPPPADGGGGGGTVLQIAALNTAFDTAELTVPAGEGFQIQFDNQDPLPHNVAIHQGSPTGPEVFRGEIVTGPTQVTYDVPPLEAGAYGFVCTVHPNMTGTLTAE